MKRGVMALLVVIAAVTAIAVLVEHRHAAELAAVDDPAAVDDVHLDIPELDPTAWVERYDAGRAYRGYTLVGYLRRVPMLIDMSGRIVHLWPRVRFTARARLAPDGRLLVIGIDDLIKEYDWEGRLVWFHRLHEGDIPHHDVSWTADGNVLVVAQGGDDHADYLAEVNRRGRVVWHWRSADHLERDFPDYNRKLKDPTHINSARELPPNRFFDGGDERFRPGNILVSARNLDTVFVIDRRTGEVVWRYAERLDRQHEALMIPKGQLGEGLVLIFDNGLRNRFAHRRSTVLAVDPERGEVRWRYAHPYFYSSVAGSEQPLANGNLLIGSSQGGRVFEITPAGDVVWQWTPPYLPMRPERYPPDYCPQLAALARPQDESIPSRLGHPFIDRELYQFAVPGEYNVREVAGTRRMILRPGADCQELVIPPEPTIYLGYGLDAKRLGRDQLTASFRFVLRPPAGGPQAVLLEDTVASGHGEPWRERWLPVPMAAMERADLCLEVATSGPIPEDRARRIVAIDNPRIDCGERPRLPRDLDARGLSPQEREVREKQLRVLGYIN